MKRRRRGLSACPARLARRKPAKSVAVGVAFVVGLASTATACADARDRLVVGSKNFSEQDLLGELVAQWIERTTDIPVERRLHLGGTFVAHRAIATGELDLYVEYTGTAYTAILGRAAIRDPERVREETKRMYEETFGITLAPPLGFENSFAMLVRASTADSLGLRRLSDAAPHVAGWTPGFGFEFMEREDGWRGLAAMYGFDSTRIPRVMDLGLMYRALAEGEVDLVAGNSTDGQIAALELVMLDDDRGYFPPYEAVPVVRLEAFERFEELGPALDRLAGRLSTEQMRAMNRAVDLEGRDYREVATEWIDRVCRAPDAGCRG